jgi:hypothetical protein
MRRWYHWLVWFFSEKPEYVSGAWLREHLYMTGIKHQ